MLNERSSLEKLRYYMIPFLWNSKKKKKMQGWRTNKKKLPGIRPGEGV